MVAKHLLLTENPRLFCQQLENRWQNTKWQNAETPGKTLSKHCQNTVGRVGQDSGLVTLGGEKVDFQVFSDQDDALATIL